MFSIWQSSEEIPFLVQLFLMAFVLIGIIPFFEKIISKMEDYFRALSRRGKPDRSEPTTGPEASPADLPASAQLNEYEYIVFRRLATAGNRGLSLKAIAGGLHMSQPRVGSVLQSLGGKGLVGSARRLLFGRRYYLTRKGRDYALEQGFIVKLREG